MSSRSSTRRRSRPWTSLSSSRTTRRSLTSTPYTTTSTSITATSPPGGPWTSARPRCTAASRSARRATSRISWRRRAPRTRTSATRRHAAGGKRVRTTRSRTARTRRSRAATRTPARRPKRARSRPRAAVTRARTSPEATSPATKSRSPARVRARATMPARARSRATSRRPRGAPTSAGDALSRGAQPGASRGDGGGRERLPHGRGHRRLPGSLQGDRRPARGVRREASARHADLREHDRRHGRGRGDDRHAPGRRADDDQLLAARDGPDREPRRRDPLHVRRPGEGADGDPDAAGRRASARAHPLALLGGLLPARAGPAGGGAEHARGRQGPAESGHPRRQPGRLHRARDPLRPARRGARERRPDALRGSRHPTRGRRRADAVLQAARAGRVPARGARGSGGARALRGLERRSRPSDVTMPRLSDSMEEGTVLKWLVDEGAEVKRGEPLVEIETDKANMTYDADTDGVLVEIVAQEGDTLPIGEVIARIGDAGEAKSGGGDEVEAGEEAEGGDGDEGATDGEDGADEASGGDDEAAEEEREPATAEGDGDAAEGKGEDDADAEGEEAAEGDREEAAEGEEAAVAGAEGGGGETQAGAGTATREKTSTGNGDGRVKASPVARRMARDLGVELAQLEGTGPGGRIVKADVQAAAENGGGVAATAEEGKAEPAEGDGKAKTEEKPAKDEEAEKKPATKEAQRGEAGVKGDVDVEELTRLQQTVSRRMAESKATAPDFSIALTVDMTAAVELRERLKQISDPVPSFNDMVVKAAANGLREFPRVNGAYRDGKFELYERVNIGIAVAAQDALVVPTVFDADKKSLGQIARDAREVIEKVKEKTVTPPELSGGTFTVSNLGMFGIEQFTAIINPPQAAILTVGKLAKQPAVDDKGKVVARDQMVLTLVCDHRILYGADGAQFLARVKKLLEQPLSLAL